MESFGSKVNLGNLKTQTIDYGLFNHPTHSYYPLIPPINRHLCPCNLGERTT